VLLLLQAAAHQLPGGCVAVSPSGKVVLTAGTDGCVALHDSDLRPLPGGGPCAEALALFVLELYCEPVLLPSLEQRHPASGASRPLMGDAWRRPPVGARPEGPGRHRRLL
jgi:hypothetical protein